MARHPYTVENQRPRRTLNVLGTMLAPKLGGGNSQCDLSEDDIKQPGVIRLIEAGRLKVTRAPAPAVKAKPVEDPAPAVEETPSVEEIPPAEEPPPAAPSLEDVDYKWGEAELFALNAADQKVICSSRGLKVGGRESARVARILSAQEGV